MTATTTATRYPLVVAKAFASEIVRLLAPLCERIEPVGSVRRGSPTVKDIEVLCIAATTTVPRDLFGEDLLVIDRLDGLCQELLAGGRLSKRLGKDGKAAWGAKYKRSTFLAAPGERVPLDIFVTGAEAWGLLQIIRTGPADYSHWLVTPKHQGGAMPFGMRSHEGQLWSGNTVVPTPDEASVYAALGLAFVPPELRCAPAGWGR